MWELPVFRGPVGRGWPQGRSSKAERYSSQLRRWGSEDGRDGGGGREEALPGLAGAGRQLPQLVRAGRL